MSFEREPETNRFGLVFPPSTKHFEYVELYKPKVRPDSVNRHHLYWPEKMYHKTDLAMRFRETRINSVWLLISEHDEIHDKYDGVRIPNEEVMERFLDEADRLELFGAQIRNYELLNETIYEGLAADHRKAEDDLIEVAENIISSIAEVAMFELVAKEYTVPSLLGAMALDLVK